MKTIKTFMAALTMVMISGAANAQSTFSANDVIDANNDNNTEWMDNKTVDEQDPIVGTFYTTITSGDFRILYVYADGTYLLETRIDSKHNSRERGFWEADGNNSYTFLSAQSGFTITMTPSGPISKGTYWDRMN